jgi:hypothetical protein
MTRYFQKEISLDGDKDNIIDKEALAQACEAMAAYEQFRAAGDAARAKGERGKYATLLYQARTRITDNSVKASPELRAAHDERERLLAESQRLSKEWFDTMTPESNEARRRANDAFYDQNRKWHKDTGDLLRRLCSPPVS